MLTIARVTDRVERIVFDYRAKATPRKRTSYSQTWLYELNSQMPNMTRNG